MLKKIALTLAALFTALTLTSCAPAATHTGVVIEDAWVRASEYSDHVGGMTGIFGKFTNHSDKVVTIVGGTTDIASMAQTHQVLGGVMQEKKDGIQLKPGETVTLEPGGFHIMIMDLKKPILSGDKITFTVKFDGAESQTLTLTAKESAGGDETYHK